MFRQRLSMTGETGSRRRQRADAPRSAGLKHRSHSLPAARVEPWSTWRPLNATTGSCRVSWPAFRQLQLWGVGLTPPPPSSCPLPTTAPGSVDARAPWAANGEGLRRPGFQKHSGIQAIRNTIGRFLSAKLRQGGQTAYVAVAVSDIFTDVHVIEIKAMDTGMAALDASVLAEGIDKDGFVVVDQIYFDTDKTSITPASAPAMQQVAKLLAARPQLKLYVVGHTDMQGTLAHNMALSKGRAVAVVDALTTDYGVAAGRLEGHGAGPLAPQATNANDAGRSLNRRVVLVVR